MASVQFIGRTALLEGVRDRLDVWGLFQGKQFLVSGESPESLDEFLKKLEPGGTVAVYTLRLYTTAEPDEIDEKTPCQGSINFKLTGPVGAGGTDATLAARLDRIEGLLSGDDDDDQEDDEESIAGIILGYLKDPQKIATIIGAYNNLRQGTLPGSMVPGSVGTVNSQRESQHLFKGDRSVFGPADETIPSFPVGATETDEARTHRLATALDRLEKADARILEHLEKLAELAEKKPQLFKLLLTQLDSGL
jgi:hypothetical protein